MVPSKGASNVHSTGSKYAPEVLKVCAIYGANGSGKSTLIRAVNVFVYIVDQSAKFNSNDSIRGMVPFALDREFRSGPTKLEATFAFGRDVWRYGFIADRSSIKEEWLYGRAFKTSRERLYYHRRAGKSEETEISRALGSYRELLLENTNDNQLFLSKLDQNNAEETRPPFLWISALFRPVNSLSDFPKKVSAELFLEGSGRELEAEAALAIMRGAGVCVEAVSVDKAEVKQADYAKYIRNYDLAAFEGDKMSAYGIEFKRRDRQGELVSIDYDDESLGTHALFALAGVLVQTLELGVVVFIDELNQTFHPEALRLIVELFYSPEANPRGAQLIFTSHDTSVMSALERDQIWLTEKPEDGATKIFSLAHFGSTGEGGPRRRGAFARQYLDNRYGGLPDVNLLDAIRAIAKNNEQVFKEAMSQPDGEAH